MDLYKKNIFGILEIGDEIEVRINKVHEDGKLDLSLRERGYVQMDEDAQTIINKLKQSGGSITLNDKSHPNEIRKELNMSKSGFKRAVGKLYKDGIIVIKADGISFKN